MVAFFHHCKDTKHRSAPRKGRKEGRAFREKYWFQIQAVVSALWNYMLDNDMVEKNIFQNLRIHQDAFDDCLNKPEEETVFSLEEAKAVKQAALEDSEAKQSAIPLGILLLFVLGLRMGELCALKWKDIIRKPNGKTFLHVQREVVIRKDGDYKVVSHAKTNAGNRMLPLNDYCKDLFQRIRRLNAAKGICITDPDEFIFQRKWKGEWKFCTASSFGPRIRKYCRQIGMKKGEEKSPHDARRTCLTQMYNNGTPIKQLQYFAGHETVQQTLDYIRRQANDSAEEFVLDDSALFSEKPLVTAVTDLHAV